jgi:hypothetical protein
MRPARREPERLFRPRRGPGRIRVPLTAISALAPAAVVADSTLGWTVGYLVVAGFLALSVIPFLVARRYGRRVSLVCVLAWGAVGVGLAIAYGDLGGLDAIVGGLLAFAGPWLVAALIGIRAHERRRGQGLDSA